MLLFTSRPPCVARSCSWPAPALGLWPACSNSPVKGWESLMQSPEEPTEPGAFQEHLKDCEVRAPAGCEVTQVCWVLPHIQPFPAFWFSSGITFFFLYEFSTEIINKLNETVWTLVWDALLRLCWPLCGSQPRYISLSLPFPRDSRWITTLKY